MCFSLLFSSSFLPYLPLLVRSFPTLFEFKAPNFTARRPFCVRLLKHEDGWPESELIVLMNGDMNADVVTTNATTKLRRNAEFEILARWLPNMRLTSVSVN